MAGIRLNPGALGDLLGTKEIGGTDYQQVVLVQGGTPAEIAEDEPLSVRLSDGTSFIAPALDATLTGGTARVKITDGTNNAILWDDGGGVITQVASLWLPTQGFWNGAIHGTVNVTPTPGAVDPYNSTTTPLGADATFIGPPINTIAYKNFSVAVIAASDQASATDGLKIEFSSDGSNWDLSYSYSVTPSESQGVVLPVQAQYYRIRYINGPDAQGVFRLQTFQLPQAIYFDIGQKTKSRSQSVTIASDQGDLGVTVTSGSISISGSPTVEPGSDWATSGLAKEPGGNLATVATETTSIDAKTPALGQALMAASVPVVLASNQSSVPISGTITANLGTIADVATQTTLAALNAKVTKCNTDAVIVASGAITETSAADIKTAVESIDAAVATEATLAAASAKLPATLGQKTKATALGVTLASDEDGIAIAGTVTITGTVTVDAGSDWAASGLAKEAGGNLAAILVDTTSIDGKVATEATLDSIDTKVATETTAVAISGKLPATLGQKTKAAALGVTLASDEDALAVAQSGAWTVTADAGSNLNTSALLTTAAFQARINTLGQKAMAAATPVVIASDQSAVPVSGTVAVSGVSGETEVVQPTAADLNMTEASAAAILADTTAIIAQLPATLGQKTKAASFAVTLASDEDTLTVDGTVAVSTVTTLTTITNDVDVTIKDAAGDSCMDEANNALQVNVVAGSATGTEFSSDDAHTPGDDGPMVLAVRRDADSGIVDTTGDYTPLILDNRGFLKVEIHDGGDVLPISGAVTESGMATLTKLRDAVAGAADPGVIAMAVRRDDATSLVGADGDLSPLTVSNHGCLNVDPQHFLVLDDCNATTGWAVLNDDAGNLTTDLNHVFETASLEFDKLDGSSNTVFAVIGKTISSISFNKYMHEGGGFLLWSIYIPDISDVAAVFIRLGTDRERPGTAGIRPQLHISRSASSLTIKTIRLRTSWSMR